MKISIIVPVYKVEKYLYKCVESLLNQTYEEIEVILVDDGSPDSSAHSCDEYAAMDSRVAVIHKKNGGSSDARKIGIEVACGTFIMFVDGDDWLSPETCQHCTTELEHEPGTDCVLFSYVREYPDHSISAQVMDRSCVLEGDEAKELVYRRLFGLVGDELRHPERLESMGSCCMRLYRKIFAKQGRFFDADEVGSSEDTLFNMYALYGCEKAIYLDEPFYHYRKTRQSITSTYRPRLIEQWGKLFDYMETVIAEKQLSPIYREALNGRIALSVFGIGSNELSAHDTFLAKSSRIKAYITTKRYSNAVDKTDISKMPLPWKMMLLFAKHRLSLLLYLELALIHFVRRKL